MTSKGQYCQIAVELYVEKIETEAERNTEIKPKK